MTITHRLEKLEHDVASMKEHMVDKDSIMTEEDYKSLLQYREEKAKKKLVSHDTLKKELGL